MFGIRQALLILGAVAMLLAVGGRPVEAASPIPILMNQTSHDPGCTPASTGAARQNCFACIAVLTCGPEIGEPGRLPVVAFSKPFRRPSDVTLALDPPPPRAA